MTKKRKKPETATFYGVVNWEGYWLGDPELVPFGVRYSTLTRAVLFATRAGALNACIEGEKPRAVRVTPLTVKNKARTR